MPQLYKNINFPHRVTNIAYQPNGNLFAVENPNNNALSIYSLESGNSFSLEYQYDLCELPYAISAIDWAVIDGKDAIIAATKMNFIKVIYDNKHYDIDIPTTSSITALKWATSSAKFAVSTAKGEVFIGHFSESKNLFSIKSFYTDEYILCLSWESTGSCIAIGTLNGYVKVYIATNKLAKSDSSHYGDKIGTFKCDSWVYNVSFMKNSLKIIAVDQSGSLSIFDLLDKDFKKYADNFSETPIIYISESKNGSFLVGNFEGFVYHVKFDNTLTIVRRSSTSERSAEAVVLISRVAGNTVVVQRSGKVGINFN